MLTLWIGGSILDWLSLHIAFGQLLDVQQFCFVDGIQSFALDACDEIRTCRDVVDQTDDLASSPDLGVKTSI